MTVSPKVRTWTDEEEDPVPEDACILYVILIFQSVSHLTRYMYIKFKIHRDTSRQDTFVSGTSVFIIASAILLRENMYIS